MPIPKNNALLPLARTLRKNMTPQEKKLWYLFLRNYPVKIYRQRIIGSCIVDFYCASAKLVIEIDGSQHYTNEGYSRDWKRSDYLESCGLQVMRFTNREVDRHPESVCAEIDRTIRSKTDPDASPGFASDTDN